MKKYKIKIILFIIIVIIPLTSYSAYEMWGVSVRAKGMADTMAAQSGDINSLFHNPAGLSTIKSIQVLGNYNMPYTGFDDFDLNVFNAAVAVPFINNPFANFLKSFFGFISFGLLDPVFKDGAYGFSFYNQSDSLYYERAYSLTYSKKLFNFLKTGLDFSLGFRFNFFSRGVNENEYTTANPYFDDGTSALGFGIDAGLLLFLSKKFVIGAYINNLLEPNVAINKSLSTEKIDRTLKYGLTWLIGDLIFMNNLNLSFNITHPFKKEGDNRAVDKIKHIGFEFWQFNHILGVRSGWEWGDDISNISIGLSCHLAFGRNDIVIDYAFVIPTNIDSTYGSHMFSLTYKFSLPDSSFVYDKKKMKEMKRLEKLKKESEKKKTK